MINSIITYKISIVIATYKREKYILDALRSLCLQTIPAHEFEVIVVDNNSQDNTPALVTQFIDEHPEHNIHFFEEQRQGASFARNTGADLARGTYLCFMDDDAVATPDFIANIFTFYVNHPEASGLGGRIIAQYDPEEPKWMSKYVASLVGNFDYSDQLVQFEPNKYPLESNMIIPKQDFDLVGGFNTALPGVKGTLRIGGEGKDFFFKIRDLGKKLYYDPSVIVYHQIETAKLTREYMYRVASGIGRGERVRTEAIGLVAVIKKFLEYCFKFGAAIVLAIQYTLQGKPAKAMPVIHFRWDVIRGFFK
jgi:glycosyltransferase involved in cell wall biosynthesis